MLRAYIYSAWSEIHHPSADINSLPVGKQETDSKILIKICQKNNYLI